MPADAIPCPEDALQAQLKSMGFDPAEALQLLRQQQQLKQKQRRDKAEKAMTKGAGKGYFVAIMMMLYKLQLEFSIHIQATQVEEAGECQRQKPRRRQKRCPKEMTRRKKMRHRNPRPEKTMQKSPLGPSRPQRRERSRQGF